jgi:hypothetical protein
MQRLEVSREQFVDGLANSGLTARILQLVVPSTEKTRRFVEDDGGIDMGLHFPAIHDDLVGVAHLSGEPTNFLPIDEHSSFCDDLLAGAAGT